MNEVGRLADHVHKYNLTAAVRACGITHMNGDPRDAEWTAVRLLEELGNLGDRKDPCGVSTCQRCYSDRPNPGEPPAPADPELAALAVITTALDGLPQVAVNRVLPYVADRYGYVLATED